MQWRRVRVRPGPYDEGITALILLSVFTMIFQRYLKPYDLPTAIFFTLALVFLAQNKMAVYLLIFLLSTINRETTILLLPVFIIFYWNHMSRSKYAMLIALQLVTFVTVQVAIRYVFRDAPGSVIWVEPFENIRRHIAAPWASLLALVLLGILLWRVRVNWAYKPRVLRVAFVVLAPALFVMYFLFGQAFEYRVFAEVFSVAAILAVT